MHVSEIWRYPVKSMRGERVENIDVLQTGLRQDRQIVVVSSTTGRVVTARTNPGLLGLQARVEEHGGITVSGLPWDSLEVRSLASEAAHIPVNLVDRSTHADRFDVLPLLVATDGAIQELGIDGRRLRPNIIVGGVPGKAEREWGGHSLRLGPVLIEAEQLRMRCVMTTYDPDTLKQDRSVLFRIVQEMDGTVALDCSVRRAGHLHENDPVTINF